MTWRDALPNDVQQIGVAALMSWLVSRSHPAAISAKPARWFGAPPGRAVFLTHHDPHDTVAERPGHDHAVRPGFPDHPLLYVHALDIGDEHLYGRADLMLLDLELPDIDGMEVCRSVRNSSDVPIISVTDSDEEFDHVSLFGVGHYRLLAGQLRRPPANSGRNDPFAGIRAPAACSK